MFDKLRFFQKREEKAIKCLLCKDSFDNIEEYMKHMKNTHKPMCMGYYVGLCVSCPFEGVCNG